MNKFTSHAVLATNIIQYVGDEVTKESGTPIPKLWDFHKSVGAPSEEVANQLVKELEEKGILSIGRAQETYGGSFFINVSLTLDGWKKYEAGKDDNMEPTGSINATISPETSNDRIRVFLAHGHDEEFLQTTARFLEQLNLKIIILREQPNQGRTIIEKIVDYSDVGFAVVLLTPDDEGRSISSQSEKLRPRARQNVILELGFFLGTLGRKKVCALYSKDVEIPSDYAGVLFVELDASGAWKSKLVREIKAAGLDVDMNLAL